MSKVLVIGQAPPAVTQTVPYDTTMFYDMLSWVGISKQQAQDIFEFEAVCNTFPGFDNNGHKKPSKEQMDKHWDDTLQVKVIMAKKIILLGNVAAEYFDLKTFDWNYNLAPLKLIHPSKRNYSKIIESKKSITEKLKNFLNIDELELTNHNVLKNVL